MGFWPGQGSHSAIADRADLEIDHVRKQGGKSTVLFWATTNGSN
jgi:hypothetical protein